MLLLWLIMVAFFYSVIGTDLQHIRLKRQAESGGGTSILTVEWEGIFSAVSDDRTIGGFKVEYRPETDRNWIEYGGIIPYQGPNVQHRVRIRDLPSGVVYYVRIKVLNRNNEVLVQSAEIRAQTEFVKIECKPGETTEPRNVKLVASDIHTLTYQWDAPQCGSVLQYIFLVEGYDDYARYDLQTQTVDTNRATVRNLLPGTTYTFRVKGVGANRREGPWTDTVVRGLTKGSAPTVSQNIRTIYKTDKQIRVEWGPYQDPQLQHYEVMILEETNEREGVRAFRAQVPVGQNGYVFSNLKPSTNYLIAVVAFADYQPRQVYRLTDQTGKSGAQIWPVKPNVVPKGVGKFSVYWEQPTQFPAEGLKGFVTEYRLLNETVWRPYGDVIEYRPNQKDYTTEISGLSDKVVYAIRVYLVNQKGEVVALTNEFNVGNTSVTSCMGVAGMPQNVQAFHVGQTNIMYMWDRPNCDESYGPVEGFEYLFWNLDAEKEPDRPTYVSGNKVTLDKLKPSNRYGFKVRSRSRGGYSPWSDVVRATTKSGTGLETSNIYDLRTVVVPGANSYLAWTPLPEHRGRIDWISLAYKISNTDNWQRVEDRPGAFPCPTGPEYAHHIKPGDYCYDLSGLQKDVQYTADVIYRLNNGEWSRRGSPFFFLLIVVVPKGKPEIREPRLSQRGETTNVNWDVTGPLQNLCCYQIDVRSDRDLDWKPQGTEIPHITNLRSYSQDLRGLIGNTRYFLRIRGLGNDRSTLTTSPTTSLTTQCQAPRSPPDNLEIKSFDPRTIVLTWNHPDRSTWGCADIWYNLEAYANNQIQRYQVRGDPRGFRVDYRIQTEPGTNWRLRVHTANTGGVSPWSREYTAQTETEAYVSVPQVSPQGTQTRVNWTSQGQGSNKVYGYIIEYRIGQDPRWQRHGSFVPYRGDNIPYSEVIYGLPIGGRIYVRILVLDRNQRFIYTSSEASADTVCSAPSLPPSNVQIQAPDPRHVRVTWEPPPTDGSQCSDIYYVLQVSEPQNVQPVRFPGNQFVHVFNATPMQRWSVQVKAINSAGQGPWSKVATTMTSPPGELIIGPTVTYQQGIPILSWRSVEGVDELVASYRVEVQTDSDPTWKPHSSGIIPYVGSQRPRTVPLDDLPDGKTAQARVIVVDKNNGIAYTSPSVPFRVPSRCRAPNVPPSGLRVQPVGINTIRTTWLPLSQNEWNCDRVWYILKYSADRTQTQGYKNLSAYENTATFDSQPNSKWTFQIQAANPAGSSPWSKEEYGQTEISAPGQITNVRVYPLTADTMQVSWDPPPNARDQISSYEIAYQLLSRGLCTDTPELEQIVQSREPRYTFQGLYPHSRYRISIRAKTNVPGEAIIREVTTPDSAPTGPPRSLQVQDVQPQRFAIRWQSPPCLQTNGEIREYEYEISGIDPWAARDQYKNKTRDTRTSLEGLTYFTKYRVRVRAGTDKGFGPWSPEVIAVTGSSETPPAPPSLRVVDTRSKSIQLMWQAPYPPQANIDRYKIQYAPSGSGRWTEQEFTLDQLRCSQAVLRIRAFVQQSTTKNTDTRNKEELEGTPSTGSQRIQSNTDTNYCTIVSGLEPEQMYDFQVASHATNGSKYGPWSTVESARTGTGPIQILNITPLGSTDNSLDIGWNVPLADQSRVQGFRITIYPLNDGQKMQQYTVDGSVYRYLIEGLLPNTTYNVTVQARTDSGFDEALSKTVNTEKYSRVPNIKNSPVIVDKKADSVTVEWTPPKDPGSITGYTVEYKVLPRQHWTQHGPVEQHVVQKPLYQRTVTGLPPNSDVVVRIRGIGKNNATGDPSPEATARTECSQPSLPPQRVKIEHTCPTGQAPRVTLTWQRPAETSWNCDQVVYELAYFTDKQSQEQIVRAAASESEYSFTSQPFTKWNVKMKTVNKVSGSQWSSPVEVTTCKGEPGRVKNLLATPLSPNEVQVTWNPPADTSGPVEGYDVSYHLRHRLACPDEEPTDVNRNRIIRYSGRNLTYTFKDLLPYSEYEVKVRAGGTEPGPEEMQSAQTPQKSPSAPPLDLKSSYALERSLGFTWDPVKCSERNGHITSYEYELRGKDDWAKREIRKANTSEPKVEIDGLTPFTKYIMRVKAYNSAGGGPATSDLEVTTAKAAAPLPPREHSVVEEGFNSIAVSWLPPYPPYGPIDAYRVRYAKDDPAAETSSPQWITPFETLMKNDPRLRCLGASANDPRFCFNITKLDSGTPYRTQVSARIEGGSFGPWSQSVTANTLNPAPDGVKSITLVSKSPTSLNISWVPPDDARRTVEKYKVCAEPTTNTNGIAPKCSTVNRPKTNYDITGLDPETPYFITVQVGSKGVFDSKVSTVYTTGAAVPIPLKSAPRITAVGPTNLTIEWDGISDPPNSIIGYIIEYRRLEDPSWREFKGVISHVNQKPGYKEQITGLNPDTPYIARVKVLYKDNKVSEPSSQAESRTGCQAPTAAPSSFQVQAPASNQIRATWRPPPSQSWQCSNIKYRLEFRNGTNGSLQYLEIPGSGTEQTFTSRPYNQWKLRIRTENPVGHSPWTDEIVVKTPEGTPGAPNVSGLSNGPDRIELNVKPPDNPNGVIQSYTITYQLKSKADCAVPVLQPITKVFVGKNHVLKDLEPASTYEVRVRAKTTVEGPPSAPILIKTEEAEPSGPPLNLEATAVQKTSAILKWEEPACKHRNGEITKYEYELDGDDPLAQNFSKKGVINAKRLVVKDLIPFTHYKFQVRAVNSKGPGSNSSSLVVLTKPDAPPAPTDVQADEVLTTATAVSFLPPSPPYGILDEYRIRHTPSDKISWQEHRKTPEELICSGNRSERLCHRVTELDPLKQYILQISAHTRDGDYGDWSEMSFITTPPAAIPALEKPLHITDVTSDTATIVWEGLPAQQLKNVDGYALEVNPGGTSDWTQYGDVVQSSGNNSGQLFSETVRNLKPDSPYFFRLKVVDKKGKYGQPGPEERTKTLCGKPTSAPKNVTLTIPAHNLVRVTWEDPSPETWKCQRAISVLRYHNGTLSGQIEIAPNASNQYEFESPPDRKWTIEMKTQTMNDNNEKGESSNWSKPQTVTTLRGTPGDIDLECSSLDYNQARCTWDQLKDDEYWSHGVDVTYQLKQRGNCLAQFYSPVTEYNVPDGKFHLQKLEPNSLYTITVTPRIPSHLEIPGVRPHSSTTEIRTGDKQPEGPPQNVTQQDVTDKSAIMHWEPPECDKQNGEISMYEYSLTGLDDWAKNEVRRASTERKRVHVKDLQPGTSYNFQVRGYTSAGPGPYSEPIKIGTSGIAPPFIIRTRSPDFIVIPTVEPLPIRSTIGSNLPVGRFTAAVLDTANPLHRDTNTEGWPWWWLLLFLLLLLLLLLLFCFLCWCLCGRKHGRRKQVITTRIDQYSGERDGLLLPVDGVKKQVISRDASAVDIEMKTKLLNVENRLESIKSLLEQKVVQEHTGQVSRNNSRDSDYNYSHIDTSKRSHRESKGDFEDGYVRGYRDASKTETGTQARRRMDEDFSGMKMDFHAGYVQGLRDAGVSGMTQSMHNLAVSRQRPAGGYSAGYMQGFQDGEYGHYGKKLTATLLNRLEQMYPDQLEFRKGYIDGFSDSTTRGFAEGDSRLASSVSALEERLSTLERSRVQQSVEPDPGAEIHTTKIYHVYNQIPEGATYQSTGVQLAHELEQVSKSSKATTVRRHYTPGDYLKYASDNEGAYGSESFARRNRRSQSASNLGRGDLAYHTGRSRNISDRYTSNVRDQYIDTYSSTRYNYRNASDLDSTVPRRYPSQTLLDGVRPGPAPTHYRQTAETLQRELGSVSQSSTPITSPVPGRYGSAVARSASETFRGYSSDTGYVNDTYRSRPTVRGRVIPPPLPSLTISPPPVSDYDYGSNYEYSASSTGMVNQNRSEYQ